MKGYCLVCEKEIEVRMCCSGFDCGCMGKPVDPPICSDKCYDIWDSGKRAFNAALEYERNCIEKYDYKDNRPSRPPVKGERMGDYASKYNTTIQAMKDCWREVEIELKRQRLI